MMTELQNLGFWRFLPYSCSAARCWGRFGLYDTKGLVMEVDTKPKSHFADYKYRFLSDSFQYFRGAGVSKFFRW